MLLQSACIDLINDIMLYHYIRFLRSLWPSDHKKISVFLHGPIPSPCSFHQLHYLIFDIAKPRLLQQRIVTSVPFQRCTAWPFRLKSHCKFRTYVSELGQYLSSMTVALVWFEVGRRGEKNKNQVTYGQKVANLGHASLQSDCSLRGTVDKHLQREVGHVLSNKLQSACWKSRRGV